MKYDLLPFIQLIEDVSGGNIKLKGNEYLVSGEIPIVDQGKDFVSGYTNNLEAKFKGDLPVIIFGDHTRIFKYVDFDFAMGADGVKVLKLSEKLYPKFGFYYFNSCYIPNTGYNRHYKYLKTIQIPLPPLPQQKRIAEILDKADALRQKNKQLLAAYNELLHATFLDMFGDPVANTKGWKKKLIKEIGNVVTGNTPPRANPENYGNYIEWIKTDNISSEIIYPTNSREFLSESGMKKGRVAPVGSILVTCIAGSLSSIGNCVITNREVAFNQQINAIISKKCNSYFLYSAMQYSKKVTQDAATKGMKKLLIKSNFEKLTLICPPIQLQNQFAQIVENIEAQKTLVKQSLQESEDLFNGLVQEAFKGSL